MAFKSRLKCLFLKPIFCILFATFLHFARNTTITQTQCDLYFIFKSKRYMVIVDANKDVCFYDMVPYNCSDLFEDLFKTGHVWPVIDE